MQEQFDTMVKQLRELLTESDDDFFAEANAQLLNSFHTYFTSGEVVNTFNEVLRRGDEQGYTLDQYLEELNQVGELFNSMLADLRTECEGQPHKQEFCDGFGQAVNAFILTCTERIVNRDIYNVAVELCHPNAKLPKYAHDTDWGADIYAVEDMTIEPGSYGVMVPTGLRVAIPHGWMISFRPRSGMSHNTPLRISNAPGTIDETYRGELKILFDNFSTVPVEIKTGDRIAQMGLEKNYKASYYQVDKVDKNTDRGEGGFGSSGN